MRTVPAPAPAPVPATPQGGASARLERQTAPPKVVAEAPKKAAAPVPWRGVRMGALGPRTIRAVTHLDVSAQGIERALDAAKAVFR